MNTTTAQPLKDGVYRWTAPAEGYRLAQAMEAVVSAGRVTAWAYVCEDGSTRPACEDFATYGAELTATLAREVEAREARPGFLHPVSFQPATVSTIGKARAARLHRLMGRAGLMEHYGFARRALGREVHSLAALTEGEARQVWGFVCHMFPHMQGASA